MRHNRGTKTRYKDSRGNTIRYGDYVIIEEAGELAMTAAYPHQTLPGKVILATVTYEHLLTDIKKSKRTVATKTEVDEWYADEGYW